jgi:hypothetical protein
MTKKDGKTLEKPPPTDAEVHIELWLLLLAALEREQGKRAA